MQDREKIFTVAALVGAAALTGWLARGTPQEVMPLSGNRNQPDYVIEDFTSVVMNENGVRRYTISAPRLTHYPVDRAAVLEAPHLTQFPTQASPVHTRAKRAILPDDADRIVMRDDVRVTQGAHGTSAGGTVTTDEMTILLDAGKKKKEKRK